MRPFENWITYNTYMRYFHYWATFSIFYIFPVLYILLNVYAIITTDVNDTWLGAYFAMFSFIGIPLMFWYDQTIKDICDNLKEQSIDSLRLDYEDQEKI